MPFSQGPRMCPGATIAWMQSKLYLAKILWTFDLEMVPGQDISFDRDYKYYTKWTKPPFYVRFVQVEREKSS
jgi:cytochrome P450